MPANPSIVSSSSRPLGVRARPDLNVIPQSWQGRQYFVVKDPVTLKFYRFEAEEYALLQLLDGQRSADEIRAEFATRFAPQTLASNELFQFIGSLHRSCLVISNAEGQATRLLHRADRNRQQQRTASLTNILAVRTRGFDPERVLDVLDRLGGWFFSWPCVVACLMLIASAATLIFANFELFGQKLPSYESFFSGGNWIWLGVVLAGTKMLHELGHGLACKRMGSQCHSMGVMFLVLMPCLYCDVSDSWTLPSRWRRIAIAAAGMYVEFVLAAVCVFVWWFSQPGLVNMLALNIIVVCSISTVLFNANPLMRYDGYYILSDLIEVPNLRQKATRVLTRMVSRLALGIQSAPDPFMPVRHRWLFGFYSIAAIVYRWLIMLSIFWFLYRLLEPYGLKLVGQVIAAMALYGLVGRPLVQLYRFLTTPGRITAVKPVRTAIAGGLSVAVVAGILAIPVPHHVRCSFVVQPVRAAPVYAEVPGRLGRIHVIPGQTVTAGQPLIRLDSPELQQGIAALEGEQAVADTRHRIRLKQASFDPRAEQDVESSLASLTAATRQLNQQRQDLERLNISAPVNGTVVAASYVPAENDEQTGRLTAWHGHPLEARNVGAWLDSGTVVCTIAPDGTGAEAILAIDQSDIEFIARGDRVRLWLRQSPGQMMDSTIDLISPIEMQQVPRGLSSRYGGDLMTTTDDQGRDVPQSTMYQVSVAVHQVDGVLVNGATGVARIRTRSQTIGQRIWRQVCQTFRFEL